MFIRITLNYWHIYLCEFKWVGWVLEYVVEGSIVYVGYRYQLALAALSNISLIIAVLCLKLLRFSPTTAVGLGCYCSFHCSF